MTRDSRGCPGGSPPGKGTWWPPWGAWGQEMLPGPAGLPAQPLWLAFLCPGERGERTPPALPDAAGGVKSHVPPRMLVGGGGGLAGRPPSQGQTLLGHHQHLHGSNSALEQPRGAGGR